jgi:hypothetical protein
MKQTVQIPPIFRPFSSEQSKAYRRKLALRIKQAFDEDLTEEEDDTINEQNLNHYQRA